MLKYLSGIFAKPRNDYVNGRLITPLETSCHEQGTGKRNILCKMLRKNSLVKVCRLVHKDPPKATKSSAAMAKRREPIYRPQQHFVGTLVPCGSEPILGEVVEHMVPETFITNVQISSTGEEDESSSDANMLATVVGYAADDEQEDDDAENEIELFVLPSNSRLGAAKQADGASSPNAEATVDAITAAAAADDEEGVAAVDGSEQGDTQPVEKLCLTITNVRLPHIKLTTSNSY